MFSYDPSNRILKVQKLAEEEVDLGLLEYQKESYQKYLTETIYSDMEYLLQVMRELLQVSQVDAEFRVGDLYCGNYVKVVNPDPKKPGETYLTYVASEDIYHWNRGDLLKVKVTEVGPTGLASFLYRVIGLNMAPVDFSLAGRIRS